MPNGWDGGLEDFIKRDIDAQVQKFQRQIGLEALRRIINRTPVDLGILRGNWQVQTGSPNVPTLTAADRSEQSALEEGKERLAQVPAYETTYIANNLPYAEVAEYGGYPNPPKHGSRIRNRDLPSRRRKRIKGALAESGIRYIVKSAGGFSLQAPLGMVRVTAMELENYEG